MNWFHRTFLAASVASLTALASAPWLGWYACLLALVTFVATVAVRVAMAVRQERRLMREWPPTRALVCAHAWTTTDLHFARIIEPQARFRDWEGPFSMIVLCRMCAPTEAMTARKGESDHAKVESRIVGVKDWPWGTLGSMWSKVRAEIGKAYDEARAAHDDDDPADFWKKP